MREAYEEHNKEEQGEKKEQRTGGREEDKARHMGDVRQEARGQVNTCYGDDLHWKGLRNYAVPSPTKSQ